MPACSAFGCTNRKSKKIPGITFHRFPLNVNKRAEWVKAVRRKHWKPSKSSVLCSAHFTEDMMDRTSLSCVRVRENAIPNIFNSCPTHCQKMQRRCCVPMCRSNRGKDLEYTSVFSFPKNETLKSKWVHQIWQKDVVPKKHAVVCIKHFEDRFIEHDLYHTRRDGTVLAVARNSPSIVNDAYPTIFEDQLSCQTTKKQKPLNNRIEEVQIKKKEKPIKWVDNDEIRSFEYFKQNFESKLPDNWVILPSVDNLYMGRIDLSGPPKFVVSLRIFPNLSVAVWHNELPLHMSQFTWLLGDRIKCDLWSTFACLISHLNGYSTEYTTETKLNAIATALEETAIECKEMILQENLLFLHEQLELSLKPSTKYSSNMLEWASTFFSNHPSAYRYIQNSKKLILPHPDHLENLQSGILSTQTNP